MAGLWDWAFPKRSTPPARNQSSSTPMSATTSTNSPIDTQALKPFISRALDSALTQAEAEESFDIIMSGRATASQIGGFLMILRLRGESIEEITGATTIMRAKATKVRPPAGAIDIV